MKKKQDNYFKPHYHFLENLDNFIFVMPEPFALSKIQIIIHTLKF